MGGVLEADAQVGLDVGTALRAAPLAAPEPEHVAETEAAQEILKVFGGLGLTSTGSRWLLLNFHRALPHRPLRPIVWSSAHGARG